MINPTITPSANVAQIAFFPRSKEARRIIVATIPKISQIFIVSERYQKWNIKLFSERLMMPEQTEELTLLRFLLKKCYQFIFSAHARAALARRIGNNRNLEMSRYV